LEDKVNLINKSSSLVETNKEQIQMMQDTISQNKKQIEKLEIKLRLCMEEITKGNDVIQRYIIPICRL
jgi:hypothetical protein